MKDERDKKRWQEGKTVKGRGWRYCRPFFRLDPRTASRRTFRVSTLPFPCSRFTIDSYRIPAKVCLPVVPILQSVNPDPAGAFTKIIRPEHLSLYFGRAYHLNFSIFLFFLNPIALV
jgi:hypothetical protein